MRRIVYLWERPDWTRWSWNEPALATPLASVRHRQGRLLGRLEGFGLSLRDEALLRSLTLDVVKSSEIEGETLSAQQVRSSLARKLGLDVGGLTPSERRVDGVVEMIVDATRGFGLPLSRERLFSWHRALFADEKSLKVGAWRDDSGGPMQVVSGAIGNYKVHYEAPPAARLEGEMASFFDWANRTGDLDPVLRAALAHLWFVTVHPFDDGNGRIARAVADWALARSEGTGRRCYSMSAQIMLERKAYYGILERVQSATMDATEWMSWFLGCLDRAIEGSEKALADVLRKDDFWKRHSGARINERQRLMLDKLIDGFHGKLTTTKWGVIAKCSPDTALRDIEGLIEQGILIKDAAGGRSTSYSLKDWRAA